MLKVIDILYLIWNYFILDTIQYFLCELGMKPQIHLLEIATFSLYHIIVRPTKIIKVANENLAHL